MDGERSGELRLVGVIDAPDGPGWSRIISNVATGFAGRESVQKVGIARDGALLALIKTEWIESGPPPTPRMQAVFVITKGFEWRRLVDGKPPFADS